MAPRVALRVALRVAPHGAGGKSWVAIHDGPGCEYLRCGCETGQLLWNGWLRGWPRKAGRRRNVHDCPVTSWELLRSGWTSGQHRFLRTAGQSGMRALQRVAPWVARCSWCPRCVDECLEFCQDSSQHVKRSGEQSVPEMVARLDTPRATGGSEGGPLKLASPHVWKTDGSRSLGGMAGPTPELWISRAEEAEPAGQAPQQADHVQEQDAPSPSRSSRDRTIDLA